MALGDLTSGTADKRIVHQNAGGETQLTTLRVQVYDHS